ncbi:MAG: sigma 54-interacting transcriptional regulator [Polyangiaceae bacterium]|nr:sigma 54-interacting transcriptional regulator [Polyangiaceae bacterium]
MGRERQTTTEEHRPPSADDVDRGQPVLLAAFPEPIALPLPRSGEIVGRAWLAEAGRIDGKVSGAHLRFHRAGAQAQIEDVGATNGTFLDARPLVPGQRVPLVDGAIVRAGGTLMVFRSGFTGPLRPAAPLGELVGPWGLGGARAAAAALAARRERNVLIEGETGTGKELAAREVARALGRRLVAINVTRVAASVFDGHLFGWAKNAYSGAGDGGAGVLRANRGGAMLLDEIGELALELQPKLLRFIETGEVLPVGASRPEPVDVAVIAATLQPLEDLVEAGRFRRDLLARFGARIALPPLRDRPEDIFAIALELWRRQHGSNPARIDVEAVERLMLHDWPGNVRDLDRALAGADPAIGITDAAMRRALKVSVARTPRAPTREAIAAALAAAGGNKSDAARRLGLSRGRLLRLLDSG